MSIHPRYSMQIHKLVWWTSACTNSIRKCKIVLHCRMRYLFMYDLLCMSNLDTSDIKQHIFWMPVVFFGVITIHDCNMGIVDSCHDAIGHRMVIRWLKTKVTFFDWFSYLPSVFLGFLVNNFSITSTLPFLAASINSVSLPKNCEIILAIVAVEKMSFLHH